MRLVILLIFISLLAIACLTFNATHAQAPATNNTISDVERPIHACEQQVTSWRNEEHIEICLVIAVIAFGVIISAVQAKENKWARATALVLGATTAILTGVNSRVFSADDRTLRRAVFEGTGIVAQLWVMADTMKDDHLSPTDRLNVKGEYLKKLLEFHAVGEKLNGTEKAENSEKGLGGLQSVYAQSSTPIPVWVQKIPSDNASLFYVGTGNDKSLTNAKQKSVDDAVGQATMALRSQAPNASDAALLALVKASVVIQDSTFAYDAKTGNYTCYSLLRVSREIQGIGVRSLPAAVSAQSPTTKFEGKGWRPADLTVSQTSGIFALDTAGGVSRLVVDQQGVARVEKLFALQASYLGSALAASEEAVFIASTNTLGCKIHRYSLKTGMVSQRLVAGRCAGIAADGNAFYVTMPDQNEIRYWDNWEARSSHSWSLAEINAPGPVVFDAIDHRLIVANGDGKAFAVSIPDGRSKLLAENLGYVTSIATSRFHIVVASGNKVLFLARSNNRGENPPSGLQSLTGGRIVGVAIDAADRLWFADYDKKLVEGPFPLS